MGLWSAYFFSKLLLYAAGYIGFAPWLNLLFAVFTALPTRNARQRVVKNVFAVPIGIALLYHDSWLPPVDRVLSRAQNVASFTVPYLIELLGRFINWRVLAALAVMLAVYDLARRKLRMSTFVFVGILITILAPESGLLLVPKISSNPVAPAGTYTAPDPRSMSPKQLDELLSAFYEAERSRQVAYRQGQQTAEPYDILLVHVCSLSWDDLEAVRFTGNALFDRFDILFTAFDSAASYSGPAAIRLLRGNCGATTHQGLYSPARPECLVIDGLQNAGFEPHWLMNHDGHFGNFLDDVSERAAFPAAPENPAEAAVAQRSFDDSPIYDDYSVLSRWWRERAANPAPRVVLYYNTISLHDGNKAQGDHASSSYAARLARFTNDMSRVLDELGKSGRRMIVLFVPEHGAAVRGDRRQIPGLREIPTPAITRVPVGVVLLNAAQSPARVQQRVDTPTSYLALSELLSRFLTDDPFEKTTDLAAYATNLPSSEPVAENDGTVIMRVGNDYMMRTPDGEWSHWAAAR